MRKQASVYLAGRVFPAGLAFLSTLAYLPLVGPAEYGRFAVPFAVASMLNLSIFQWIRVSYTRKYVQWPQATETLTAILIGLTVLGVCVVAVLAAAIGALDQGTLGIAIAVTAMTAALALSDANLEIFRAKRAARTYAAIFAARQSLISATSLWLAFRGYGHLGLIAGVCVGNLAIALISLARQIACLHGASHENWRARTAEILLYGWPLSLNYALSAVMNSSDRIIINALLGPFAAGIYSFAADIAKQTVMTVMEAINLGAFPQAAAALEQEGPKGAQRQLSANFELINLAAIPVVAGISLVALPVSKLSLDEKDAALAAGLMAAIAVATYFRGLRVYYFDQAFQLGNKTIGALKGSLFSACILLVSCPLLVSTNGIMGAAFSSIAAFGSALCLSRVLGSSSLRMPTPIAAIVRPMMGATLMAAVVLYVPKPWNVTHEIVQSVLLGIASYGIAMLALDAMGLRTVLLRKLLGHRNR